MEITEERIRQIIHEELDKCFVCGYSCGNINRKKGYFPIGVIVMKEQLLKWNSKHLSEPTMKTS